MHGSRRRLAVVALLLAAVPAAASASAAQPAPSFAPQGAVSAALTSAAESLARLWGWIDGYLPPRRPQPAPVATLSPAGGAGGPAVRPDDGSALDPNG